MAIAVVTGYVPIKDHPRSASEYGALGELIFPKLKNATVIPRYEKLEKCWLWKRISILPYPTTHSPGDNPAKNTLAYHCVNHQKFWWLKDCAVRYPEFNTFVWLDYGIGHVPGVTAAVIDEFLARIKQDDFAIPGCWEKENTLINDFWPCWRFCGGLMVVPHPRVRGFYDTVKKGVLQHLYDKGNLDWEVNTLARVEPSLPNLRWYKADHDASMFEAY